MAVVRGDRLDHDVRRRYDHDVDLHDSVGQLFVIDARAGSSLTELERHVRDNRVGGVIWFQATTAETAAVNERLQSLARIPLLISADLESGMGMRFTDAVWWPPAMAIAAAGDPSYAEEMGRATAREALAIGVNHVLAPVADVNVDPRNPVINTRSFGEDPHEVGRFVAAFVRGVQEEGCLATAKHFPGHGDTHVDSHRSLPLLHVDRERLDAVELVPFRAALEAGVASVMVGHLAVPAIDPSPVPVREDFENTYGTFRDEIPRGGTMPATLSAALIDLLRTDLGFSGLIVTDAMDMGGLAAHFDPGEAAIRAIEAGNDQVLFSPDPDRAIRAVHDAVLSGRLSRARIDASVERVLHAKARVARGPSAVIDSAPAAETTARRSISLVRDRAGLLPLRASKITVRAFADDPLDDALRALGGGCAIGEAEAIILLLGMRPRSGAGKIAVPEEARRIVREHGERTIAISFGSPYILGELADVSTFVCAWGVQPVQQRAAIEAIRSGEFHGRLPVTLSSETQ